jgi:hypothetical protein
MVVKRRYFTASPGRVSTIVIGVRDEFDAVCGLENPRKLARIVAR